MLKIETIENLKGFGNRNAQGEFYHSENLLPGQFGLEGNISIVDDTLSITPTMFNWFAEASSPFDTQGLWAVDTLGKLYKKISGTWTAMHDPGSNSSGNGLMVPRGGNVYYVRDRYMGFTSDGITYSDTEWDLGSATATGAFKPMETYEDWMFIGNGRKIAAYNFTDASFNNTAFTLPTNFVIRSIKSNQTGLLIGANNFGRSVIMLWDAIALRSISAWIWFESPILSICTYGAKWIVTTAKGQFITDGYSVSPLPLPPDAAPQSDVFNCLPDGTKTIGNKLYTSNTSSLFNRLKSGLYIQNLETGQFSFVTADNGCKTDMTMGAMYLDSLSNHYISYFTNLPSAPHVAQIKNQAPDFSTLISPRLGPGSNNKIAEGVKVDLSIDPKTTSLNASGSFNVSLKIYNFKRQLWGYGVTNGTSASAITLKVDGTVSGINNAKVGDEVTMLSGANAGLVRHIASISGGGTSSEVWTLDSALTGNTESGAYFNVQPYQLVKTKPVTISSLSELESIYFDIKNRIKGRKFLIKAVVTDMSGVIVDIPSLTFVYDDMGLV